MFHKSGNMGFVWNDEISLNASSFNREFQGKFTEFTRFGSDIYPAFTLVNNAIANCQSQAHALAHVLGGIKRIEYLVQVLGGNSGPVVTDDQNTLAIFNPPFDPNHWLLVFKGLPLQRF